MFRKLLAVCLLPFSKCFRNCLRFVSSHSVNVSETTARFQKLLAICLLPFSKCCMSGSISLLIMFDASRMYVDCECHIVLHLSHCKLDIVFALR
jgi:hypothetical protein